MRYFTRLQVLMGGICLALLCVLIYEWMLPPSLAAVPALAGRVRVALAPLPMASPSPPIEAFDAINARPLFKPDRRPVDLPPPAQGAADAPPPTVSLIGVIIDGSRRLALLRVPQSPMAVSASVGDDVQGWHVAAVYADHVTLRLNTAEITIALNANRPSDTPSGQEQPPGSTKPASPAGTNNEQQL